MSEKLVIPEGVEVEPVVEDNVVLLRPDIESTDGDWLWGIPIGSVFLMAQRPQYVKDRWHKEHAIYDHNLGEYHVLDRDLWHGRKNVKLLNNMNEEHKSWVESKVFSSNFILASIRYLGNKE